MKQNELIKFNETGSNNKDTFETTMANLCSGLGFTVSDDITLARYNEYRKIIIRKNTPKDKKHGG